MRFKRIFAVITITFLCFLTSSWSVFAESDDLQANTMMQAPSRPAEQIEDGVQTVIDEEMNSLVSGQSVSNSLINYYDGRILASGSNGGFIDKSNTLWLWGDNSEGQLGNGTRTSSLKPVKVLSNVVKASLGYNHGAAIKADGTLWVWGDNSVGQIGDGTNTDRLKPVKVMSNVSSVKLGNFFSGALKKDGSLWLWGRNADGRIGNGTTSDINKPVKAMTGVKSFSLGTFTTAAIKSDGTLWCWGDNTDGACGDGTTVNRKTPVKIMTNVTQVSLGDSHGLALRSDGSAWSWGSNSQGQVGDGTTTARKTPVKIFSTGIAQVSSGFYHGAVLKKDGTVWTFGRNTYYELGDGTKTSRLKPVKVFSNAVFILLPNNTSFSSAVKSNNSLWSWGLNANGRLGDGTTTDRSKPVLIKSGLKGSTASVQPTKVSLNKTSITLEVGETSKLSATVSPSNAANKQVSWSSSNSAVVSVSSNGTVTGKKVGTAKVTVKTKNGYSAKCSVKVVNKTSVNPESFSKSVAKVFKQNPVEYTPEAQAKDRFFAKRLVVKTKNSNVNLNKYKAKNVIKGPNNIYFLQFSNSTDAKNAYESISKLGGVKFVEPDSYAENVDGEISSGSLQTEGGEKVRSMAVSHQSWGVERMGFDTILRSTNKKNLVKVAVIDTGINDHDLLKGKIDRNDGFNYVGFNGIANDDNGHGTHVAGTIADCTQGINLKLIPYKVLNSEGRGSQFNIALAVETAAYCGAKVINLSLGGGHSDYMDECINNAVNNGSTVVVAAGNDNVDVFRWPSFYPDGTFEKDNRFCPAHLDKAIVVGAIDKFDNKAEFSNFGASVDFVAPGQDILACDYNNSSGYRLDSGTSMAAPHVSAAAAVLLAQNPKLKPSQVQTLLKHYAVDLGDKGQDYYYGYGLICFAPKRNIPNSAVTYNGHSYLVYNLKTTWPDAEAKCKQMGGHLVTITSQSEQDFIHRLLNTSTLDFEGYWMGSKKDSNKKFTQWRTGEKFNYSYFDRGEPNGSGDYLQIYKSGLWDDTTPDGTGNSGIKTHGFICEWDYR